MQSVYRGQNVKIKQTAFDYMPDEDLFYLRGETGQVIGFSSCDSIVVRVKGRGEVTLTLDDLEDADNWQL